MIEKRLLNRIILAVSIGRIIHNGLQGSSRVPFYFLTIRVQKIRENLKTSIPKPDSEYTIETGPTESEAGSKV
jgi:hypothetical protein